MKSADKATIPPLLDDPEYGPAFHLERALFAAMQKIDNEVALLRIDRIIASERSSKYDQDNLKRQAKHLRSQLGQPQAKAVPATVSESPDLIAAIELLRGGELAGPQNVDALIVALLERRAILHKGLIIQAEIVEEIKSRKSYELALALSNGHRQLLLELYRAAQALVRAAVIETELRRSVVTAGYVSRDDILSAPWFPVLALAGREEFIDSPISNFRRQLEASKVI